MKTLERDLGLVAVLAISIGAMIGSGIFILPALAFQRAGPAVMVAYALAGVLVLPAALSKSEMATAMPEAGGTYIYIERGMGPLLGTIAGVGTWFSLSFKGALALVGGVPYLLLVFDLPLQPVALGLATLLILVNLIGVKQTGRAQVVMVVIMLLALGWFAAGSVSGIERTHFDGFLNAGASGLLAATGLVFVSYAGVTKVASVAEEVENPGRNIPIGILGSLAFTTVLYVVIVAVIVGVTDGSEMADSITPVALAAKETLGDVGVAAVIAAAILALVSTANAGILSSSRYPFAMSRDGLAPASLGAVHDRFGTPISAITLTGAVLLLLIAFVPILEIAKLASAFQILVFALVNLAVIAFRHGWDDYDPTFESPLYPWMQIAGVGSGGLLLTQMGLIPMLGAGVITVGSVIWYAAYVKPRVTREGAATDAIRQQVSETSLSDVAQIAEEDTRVILVALTKSVGTEREEALIRLAGDLVQRDGGRVIVGRFEEIPDQAPLTREQAVQTPGDRSFETRMQELGTELNIDLEADEIVSHDTKHAIVNFADRAGVDAIVAEHEPLRLRSRMVGDPIDWVVRHAHCDVFLVDNLGYSDPTEVALAGANGPYPPVAVDVAAGIAAANGGRITLWDPGAAANEDQQAQTIQTYQEELAEMLAVPVQTTSVAADGSAPSPDVLIRPGPDHRVLAALISSSPTIPTPGCTTVTVYPHASRRPSVRRRLMERLAF